MKLLTEERGDIRVVHVLGELADVPDAFSEAIIGLLTAPGAKIILDLAGVSFLNSAGVSELVRVTAQANVQEGRIILTQLTPFIEGVLQTTQLDRFLEVAPSIDEAAQQLRSPRRAR